MRDYELMYILTPDIEEEPAGRIAESIGAAIQSLKGEMGDVKPWGRRKLAYPIGNNREGGYVEMHFKMNPAATRDLERSLRLNESIMRYLLTTYNPNAKTK